MTGCTRLLIYVATHLRLLILVQLDQDQVSFDRIGSLSLSRVIHRGLPRIDHEHVARMVQVSRLE